MTTIIIGGGASGMMAAISASKNNDIVYLVEKNEKLGKKMFITGKGRCNITNAATGEDFFNNIIKNKNFMYSSINDFNNEETMKFFDENGCKIKIERGDRVFPSSDKSSDAIDCLKKCLKKKNVKILLNTECTDIKVKGNKVYEVVLYNKELKKEETIKADKVIIATGGFSYQTTGSDGSGYNLSNKLGIKVVKISPVLVPYICEEEDELTIISPLLLKNVSIKLMEEGNKKPIYEDFGEINIRDGLLDGPIIISSSSMIDIDYDIDFKIDNKNEWFINKYDNSKKYYINIDLKPAIDESALEKRLLNEINKDGKMKLEDLMKTYLPIKMLSSFMKRLGIINKNIADLNKEERKKIIYLLKNYRYNIVKKAGFKRAIVTRGGIDTNEINKKTLESKNIKGLYFAGEIIDVDCLTGGFNMQCAFSTGYKAGLGGEK